MTRLRLSSAMAAATLLLVAACGSDDASDTTTSEPRSTTGGAPGQPAAASITLLAYDSFVEPAALGEFTAETGITVTVARAGDTGTMVNKALLTAGNPEADVLWGIDGALLSRAIGGELFEQYTSPELHQLDPAATALVPGFEATPVNIGDVCLNYDTAWFATAGVAPPATFDELTAPAYRDLLVVPSPATSGPGLAFLLATIAHFGPDAWPDYWDQLRDNGVLVVDSWDAAYFAEFTMGGSDGARPIVVSYASSPPAGILFAPDPKPTDPGTAMIEATCLRQYEFAGVLAGTEHPDEARRLVDFLVSASFQAQLPESNFVYPVRRGITLPEVFATFGPPASNPLTIDPAIVAAERDRWIDEWTAIVVR